MLTVEQMKSEIEALTKERDDAVYACGLVVQRCDRLVIERDALAAEVVRLDAGWHDANGDTLDKALELDKVKAAAKLALDALEVATTPLASDRQEVLAAITALRQAGVQ